jgi:uncharacterized membrane protein YhaH (DUF805 family)
MGYMFLPLRRYADFEGRSRRKEFWLWQLFNFVVVGALTGGLIATAWAAIVRVQARGGITPNYSSYSYSESYGGFSSSYSWNIDPLMLLEELGTSSWILLGLICLWGFIVFIPALAVAVRRLHDTNRSGWWILIYFIPLAGFIALFVFFVLEGTRGPNRFGPDPKYYGGPPRGW